MFLIYGPFFIVQSSVAKEANCGLGRGKMMVDNESDILKVARAIEDKNWLRKKE